MKFPRFFWKIFYVCITIIFSILICQDSWEYLYQEDASTFREIFEKLEFTVFQSQAYTSIKKLSVLTSFLYTGPFLVISFLGFYSSSLFIEECYIFLIYGLCNDILIRISFGLTNFFLPVYFEDLFYYQSQNFLSDRMFNFEFKWLLNSEDYLNLKLHVFFIFCFLMIFPCFLYFYSNRNFSVFLWTSYQKIKIYFLFLLLNLFFFEYQWFHVLGITLFLILCIETVFILICIIQQYNKRIITTGK